MRFCKITKQLRTLGFGGLLLLVMSSLSACGGDTVILSHSYQGNMYSGQAVDQDTCEKVTLSKRTRGGIETLGTPIPFAVGDSISLSGSIDYFSDPECLQKITEVVFTEELLNFANSEQCDSGYPTYSEGPKYIVYAKNPIFNATGSGYFEIIARGDSFLWGEYHTTYDFIDAEPAQSVEPQQPTEPAPPVVSAPPVEVSPVQSTPPVEAPPAA